MGEDSLGRRVVHVNQRMLHVIGLAYLLLPATALFSRGWFAVVCSFSSTLDDLFSELSVITCCIRGCCL